MIGEKIYNLAKKLFPINRSLTGTGNRETLKILKEICPTMTLHEIASGTQVFDWVIPDEWQITQAYIVDPEGKKIVDFKNNNLHVLGYSTPIDTKITLDKLNEHLYSLPEQPEAIPYITSYYKERWGFCLTHKQKESLKPGTYHAVIDSKLFAGSLSYGEIIIPGETDEEIFLSTYICHPSLANNELSGPCVTIYLAQWLAQLNNRKYTYRIIFIPETIGAIAYLSKNYQHLKDKVIAGFNVSCIGDDRAYSYLPSRAGNTISDKIAKHVLKWIDPKFVSYTWSDRGSDERQYCAPGIDLPIATIMRTKYGVYPEYHTSLDNLDVVTPNGFQGGFNALQLALEALENNCYPKMTVLGEPQLGKRGLYPTVSSKTGNKEVRNLMDFISHSDGVTSLIDIAEKCNIPVWQTYPMLNNLFDKGLITKNFSNSSL